MILENMMNEYELKRKDDGNILLTDMAIYIDNNINNQDSKIQAKCLEYMEQLYFWEAVEHKYFDNAMKDMEGDMCKWFAQWSALRLYYQYLSERKSDSKNHHLKSCSHYIHHTSSAYKFMFKKSLEGSVRRDDQILRMAADKEIQLMQAVVKNKLSKIEEAS